MHPHSLALVSPAAPQTVGSAAQRSRGSKPELPTASKPVSADRKEICLFFILKKCSYKGNVETIKFLY